MVAVILLSAGLFTRPHWYEAAVIGRIVANGVVISGILVWQNWSYRNVIHPSPVSVFATMALLAPPILLLVPADYLISALLTNMVEHFLPMTEQEKSMFVAMLDGGLTSVLAVCLIAPVVEELLFRGVILRSFLLRYSPAIAIVHSAAVFGLIHLNVHQFMSAFGFGLFAGWLYWRFRSTLPCMLAHAAFNIAVLVTHRTVDDPLSWSPPEYAWVLALPCALLAIWLLRAVLSASTAAATRSDT